MLRSAVRFDDSSGFLRLLCAGLCITERLLSDFVQATALECDGVWRCGSEDIGKDYDGNGCPVSRILRLEA